MKITTKMAGQSNNTDLGNAVNFLLKGRWRLNFYSTLFRQVKYDQVSKEGFLLIRRTEKSPGHFAIPFGFTFFNFEFSLAELTQV